MLIPRGGRPDGLLVLLVIYVNPSMRNDVRCLDELVLVSFILGEDPCGTCGWSMLKIPEKRHDKKGNGDCVPNFLEGMDELRLLADTRHLPGVESWVGSFLLLSSAIAVGSLEDTLSYSNVERPNQTLEKIKVDAIRGDQLNSCHALIVQIPLKR